VRAPRTTMLSLEISGINSGVLTNMIYAPKRTNGFGEDC